MFAGGLERLYRSVDGSSWETIESPHFEGTYVGKLNFLSAETALIGQHDVGVLRTTDTGNSWSRSTSGLDTARLNSLVIGSGNVLYLSTREGFFVSYDGSLNWYKSNSGDIHYRAIWQDQDGSVWVSTSANGIYRGTIPPGPPTQ